LINLIRDWMPAFSGMTGFVSPIESTVL